MESAAVRAARLQTDDLTALSERVRRLEQDGVKAAAVSSGTVQPAAAAETPTDAKSVWGRLTTHFREIKNMAMYTLVGEHRDFAIKDGTLVIYAADEDFFRFSEPGVTDGISAALKGMNMALKVKVEKKADAVDMDKEISNIKKLIGNAKLNITK